MQEVKIESNIPVPVLNSSIGYNWPFKSMKIGDSFEFSGDFNSVQKLRSYASQYKIWHPDFDYITRKTETGIRVWRIAVRGA